MSKEFSKEIRSNVTSDGNIEISIKNGTIHLYPPKNFGI